MFKKTIAVLALLTVLFLAAPGQAAQGLYFGTGLGMGLPNQSGDVIDNADPQIGFAWEMIDLGYNFTENLGIGLQWGAAIGDTDWEYDDLMWGQDYFTLSGRYTFAGQDFEPYVEVGAGAYAYSLIADDYDIVSDPALGARVALGGNYNIGHLYLAPEISYHFVNYDEADVNDEVYGDGKIDFEERGDMLLIHFKIGYQVGG